MESASLRTREAAVQQKALPRHVAIIMDGNGRWAERKNRPRHEGHREGSQSVRDVTRCARRIGVQALTLYAFSAQNWMRPPLEVAGLMELLREFLLKEKQEILDNQIRLNAIGQLSRLPNMVLDALESVAKASSHHHQMILTLALSYGGREELVRAIQNVAAKVARGELAADKISEKDIEEQLWTKELPPLDLVIRTSGENRISNFLLWQGAYAEYVFVDTLWPDFRAGDFLSCIEQFQKRERRFGLTTAQLRTIP